MSTTSVLGIDLAKSVFQLHASNDKGRCLFNKSFKRSELADFVARQTPCLIAMEACGGAHYWGRKFSAMGHKVKLIPPQFVKPFVKSNKNDSADAEAISEAAVRPNIQGVPLKEGWHLDIQAMLRARNRLVHNRTALTNEMRGILAEFGVTLAQGDRQIHKLIHSIVEDKTNELTSMTRGTLLDLYDELKDLETRIGSYDLRLRTTSKENETCQRLQKVPGVGVLSSLALVAATPQPAIYKNGRSYAAWVGLVPRHTGSGGKNINLGISKRGDSYLRCLLVHGARAAKRTMKTKTDKRSQWVNELEQRRGSNRATVALANKNARICWAILNGQHYKAG
jgi:transposase